MIPAFGSAASTFLVKWDEAQREHERVCRERLVLIAQRFQHFSASLSGRDVPAPGLVFDGRIEASTLRAKGTHVVSLQLEGDTMRMLDTRAIPEAAGRTFQRAQGARC